MDDVISHVRLWASLLQDFKLLGKFNEGDMHAIDAYYNARCLVSYYNRAQRMQDSDSNSANDLNIQGVVLAELIAYIEDIHGDQTIAPVFNPLDAKLFFAKLL